MKISNEVQAAFINEMEKISSFSPTVPCRRSSCPVCRNTVGDRLVDKVFDTLEKTKKASILQNIGKPIANAIGGLTTPRRLGAPIAGAFSNAVQTAKGFAHPVKGTIEGAKFTARDVMGKNPLNPGKHPVMAGMMGLGLAMGANELRHKEDPTGQDRGRGQRIGDFAGGTIGGLIGSPFGLTGGVGGGIVGQKIGATAGRAVDRLRGHKPNPQQVDPRMALVNSVSPVTIKRRRKAAPAEVQPEAQVTPEKVHG